MNPSFPDKNGTTLKRQVLLAEDDESSRRFFERLLSLSGYEVHAARNGSEAKSLLHANSFDVVLSDIGMPGLDGIQLLKAVRERDLDVPVILATGDPCVETAAQAVEYGALRYLSKPVEPKKLLDVIAYASRIHDLAKIKREALSMLGHRSRGASDMAGLEALFQRSLGCLWMAFQPIVDCKRRRIHAYEALVRSDEGSSATSVELLESAERLECLPRLGRAIRERICEELDGLPDGQLVFVNVHPSELEDDALYSADSPLTSHASRVVLEITERKRLDGVSSLDERIRSLREQGFRFAVDDLGSGYAGLGSFIQLDPDVVKLDMDLIRDVDSDPLKARLVRSIVELCCDMRIEVVAEGVETAKERDALCEIGVDYLQGFFFGRPRAGFREVDDRTYS